MTNTDKQAGGNTFEQMLISCLSPDNTKTLIRHLDNLLAGQQAPPEVDQDTAATAWASISRMDLGMIDAAYLALSQIDPEDPDGTRADIENAQALILDARNCLDDQLEDLKCSLRKLYPEP
ncbi:MAG TPA: hypothetical protein VFD14_05525 [Clostridia bacterium]|nr:hypothetical protein [Clostridia bacterium]